MSGPKYDTIEECAKELARLHARRRELNEIGALLATGDDCRRASSEVFDALDELCRLHGIEPDPWVVRGSPLADVEEG